MEAEPTIFPLYIETILIVCSLLLYSNIGNPLSFKVRKELLIERTGQNNFEILLSSLTVAKRNYSSYVDID